MRIGRLTRAGRRPGLPTALAAAAAVCMAAPFTGATATAHAAVRKHVDTDYTLLRRAPASYVIGTAYRDWTADVHGDQQDGYRWARVYGNLNTCLWIYSGAVSGDAAQADSCSDPVTMPVSEFTNGQIGGGTSDGATVTTTVGSGCAMYDGSHITAYGNVRPWEVPTTATAPLNSQVAIGQTVLWRYVSRDGRYVMVRDPRSGGTDGTGLQSWYFIPRGCLPATLP
ncbi:hypothetical protein ABZS81_22160 [Streptomyces sp. NPDC005318]|uniref:hypothetical protein n=1 Tax=Streptomyces sp. NPDC005318 TaxID=3157031 RepID=UPI0033A262A2